MKYISNNIFSDFEFHDAHFEFEKLEGDSLTISVRFLNIHKNTEQNTYETDMEIDIAHITFSNFRVISFEPGRGGWKKDENGKYYTDEPQVIFEGKDAEAKLFNELKAGTEVMEFGTLDNGNAYWDGIGVEPWYNVEFLFDTATIGWDEYRKPAWYEKWPFKK